MGIPFRDPAKKIVNPTEQNEVKTIEVDGLYGNSLAKQGAWPSKFPI